MAADAFTRVGTAERRRAVLELVRPANVATSLADVLAGAAIATGGAVTGRLGWLLVASACLYAGGIVLNDYFDRTLDARERPERPIPSGRIRARDAARLGAALLGVGIACALVAGTAPAVVALGIAAAVLAYDAWSKHHALAGPVNMGLCRALNLMLGMAIADAGLRAWPLAAVPLVYIAAVTVVSRGEVNGARRPVAALALTLVVLVLAALAATAGWRPWLPGSAGIFPSAQAAWTGALLVWLAARVLPAFWRAVANPTPGPLRRAVRTGVLSLVVVDGVIAAAYAGIIYSLAVLATGLLAWWLARRFAVT